MQLVTNLNIKTTDQSVDKADTKKTKESKVSPQTLVTPIKGKRKLSLKKMKKHTAQKSPNTKQKDVDSPDGKTASKSADKRTASKDKKTKQGTSPKNRRSSPKSTSKKRKTSKENRYD